MPSSYSSEHSETTRPTWPGGPASTSGPCRSRRWSRPSCPRSTLTGLAEENLQARVRGILLMGLSNQDGHLVLATGNKTELAVGYSTLYGDSGRRLRTDQGRAEDAGVEAGPVAQRRRGQARRDAADPGELDHQAAVGRAAPGPAGHRLAARRTTCSTRSWPTTSTRDLGWADLVAAGHDPTLVEQVIRLVDRAEYKRRQYPPGPKISLKAFGRDRRLPISSRWRETAPPEAVGPHPEPASGGPADPPDRTPLRVEGL